MLVATREPRLASSGTGSGSRARGARRDRAANVGGDGSWRTNVEGKTRWAVKGLVLVGPLKAWLQLGQPVNFHISSLELILGRKP